LTGHIGTASAKILISSVIKEDKLALLKYKNSRGIKENIIINTTDTSNELKKISDQLKTPIRN
jgi:hypothetical protein